MRVEQGAFELRGFNANGGTDTGGYVVADGARLEFTGGNRTLAASAEVAGTVAFLGGSVTNGATWRPGASPGILTVESNYPAGSGLLEMELGDTLRLALVDDFAPQEGDRFIVITAPSVTGMFAALDLPDGVEASGETTDTTAVLVIGLVVGSEAGGEALLTDFALHAAFPTRSPRKP